MIGYVDVYFVLYITIKSDMKTAQKVVNNLMNENIFPLKVISIRQGGWYLGITNLVKTHFSHTKSFNIPVSIGRPTLAHMLNGYEICLNKTNYPIFNMQYFRYWLCISILYCFGQLVSPLSTQTVTSATLWYFPLPKLHFNGYMSNVFITNLF